MSCIGGQRIWCVAHTLRSRHRCSFVDFASLPVPAVASILIAIAIRFVRADYVQLSQYQSQGKSINDQ